MRSVHLPHFHLRAPAPRAETCWGSEDGQDCPQPRPACPGPLTPLTVPPGSLSGRGAPTAPPTEAALLVSTLNHGQMNSHERKTGRLKRWTTPRSNKIHILNICAGHSPRYVGTYTLRSKWQDI